MGRYFDKDKFGKRLLELMADIDEQDARNYVSKTDYAGRAVKKDRDPAVGDQSDHPD